MGSLKSRMRDNTDGTLTADAETAEYAFVTTEIGTRAIIKLVEKTSDRNSSDKGNVKQLVAMDR